MNSERQYIEKLKRENEELKSLLKTSAELQGNLEIEEHGDIEMKLFRKEFFDLMSRDHMYRKLIESMSEGALVINNKNTIVYSNKHFADFIGYKLQKVIGSDFHHFLNEHNINNFQNCIEQAKTKKSFCEVDLKHSNNDDVAILMSISSLFIENEKYYCIIMTDISSQKQIEKGLEYKVEERTLELAVANKKLKKVNRDLKSINEYLDNFVHALAHDMRTPVANLKLIEEIYHQVPDEQKEKMISSIFKNIDRLDNTLQGLVQIIDLQEEKEIIKKNIDMISLLNEVLEEEQERIGAMNAVITVEKNTEEGINYVEVFLKSIFRNIISNALKYHMPGRQLKLKISLNKNEKFFVLKFIDNGLGMDIHNGYENLFKPFSGSSSDKSGMGIGLYMINNMVKKNGGYIKVESEPGKGSAFTVFLKEYHL